MAKKKQEEAAEVDPMDEIIQRDYDLMSGSQRAAVLMLLLGEQQAAEIVQFLNPKEVSAVGTAMVDVSDLSQDLVNKVLDDFILTIKKQTNLGLGTADYVKNVLKRALGEDKAATVLGKIMPASTSKGLEILQWMDARSIAEIIESEHPQISAIILSVLEADTAAQVLSLLPENQTAKIIERVATLDSVQPAAMQELEGIMTRQFTKTSAKSSSIGGVETAATIMNYVTTDLSNEVMDSMNATNEDLATKIQDQMFTFDNLATVDNKGIQRLLAAVNTEVLMAAIRGANEVTKNNFLDNMSERARLLFLDDMEDKGPIRIAEVESAQRDIIRIAKKMSDDGEIVLVGKGDDFV
ncbi:flagellar motor switch protein FliG [Porticoccaceae bacterium]|jgi:flagellar motor switch protein FliG|nr:flagellar motor switch protein FliG [Porticoccaceae bacterium]MDA8664052.1 flagellar motor switch protein FliG [Porticoccaceae bacterium]MDA8681030.1 flagellar motor switch protein FliG [Porticoccaceae bacterium]MDB2635377.1 flagellar motor switch protein FliG [Porticoccaceae bacterium]MDB2664638.1 flagellar motor switch protein FliG [Porticoccaceae bacterium]